MHFGFSDTNDLEIEAKAEINKQIKKLTKKNKKTIILNSVK
jgi:hypothetical protein